MGWGKSARRPLVSGEDLDAAPGAEGPSQEAAPAWLGRLAPAQDAAGREPAWEVPGHAVGPSATHPLLPVTVLQVVDGAVIPVQPDAHQVARQEAIFCQDHKVGEEATKSLDHSWGRREGR